MSTPERPDATLPLPNALAYAITAVALVAAAILPFAVVAGGASLADALANYDLNNVALVALLGALILWRRPGHVIGWVLVGVGGLDSLLALTTEYRLFGLGERPGLPTGTTVEDLFNWLWVPTQAGLAIVLPQLFPDGRLLSRRWWPLAWFTAAATALLAGLFALSPDATRMEWLFAVAFPLFAFAGLASLVPLAVRYRRARGAERQQFKWVFFGLAVSIPMPIVSTLPGVITDQATSAALTLAPLLIVPVAITVAVLRFRLYDIDVVISRTLLVAGLAAFITVAYVAIVVGVGSLLGGGDEASLGLSVVATAVVAVAFQPVRLALQRVANRLVYGHRATPYDVLSGFATRVGAAEPSPESLERLAELLATGTGADPARVWLRVGSVLRPEVTWPPGRVGSPPAVEVDTAATTQLPDADLAVPVRDRGELLGVLTIAKPRGERVTESDTNLLSQLAVASGVVLRNLRLDAELAQRLTDLEASRRRLYTAQDDARQRIEADLAGGSRAQLSTLRERLAALARDVDPAATPKTAMLLGQLVAQTDGALDTLAGLAAGVYPPRLAADGLAAALTEQAAKAALPVSVHADGIGRYPRETESAVYFSVLEALQNTAKYADATSAQVRLRHDGDQLRFEVTDDGAGFDPATTNLGTGLHGITDRLDTVAGTLTIASTPGVGTTLTGKVPIQPPTPDAAALTGATR